MRIITGSARGTKLETLEGEETRPTTERVKEAIFSMIQFEIENRRVLDLFGGSGQLALEALSRGASKATIADESKEAVDIIIRNAKKTHLFEKCRVVRYDYKDYIRAAAGREQFDLIFLDPPYAKGYLWDALKRLVEGNVAAPGAIILCESGDEETNAPDGLIFVKQVRYSRTFISVFRMPLSEEI